MKIVGIVLLVALGAALWGRRARGVIVLEGERFARHPFDKRFAPLTLENPEASGGRFLLLNRRDRVEYDLRPASGAYRVLIRLAPSGMGQTVRLSFDRGPELVLWGPGGERFADLDGGWVRLGPGTHRLRVREGEEPSSPTDVAGLDVIRLVPTQPSGPDEIPAGPSREPLPRDLPGDWTPGPDWLRRVETFSGEYSRWTDATFARRRGYPLLLLDIGDRERYPELVARAHRQGTRVLAPLSLHTWRWKRRPGVADRMRDRDPRWLEEWALLARPEWALVLGKGQTVSPFTTSYQEGTMREPCLNAPGVAEASLAHARSLLDTGVDGLFIDNVNPKPVCFGPQNGRHAHVDPTIDNALALKRLIAQIRQETKGRGADHVVIINTGGPARFFWEAADGYGLESFLFEGRHPGPIYSFRQILLNAMHYAPYLKAGGAVLVFSYIPPGSRAQRKAWTYYAYAAAKLSGFAWTDWDHADGSGAESLRHVRLGPAAGPMEERDGVWTRRYANGIVAMLPGGRLDTPLALLPEDGPWRDEFTGEMLRDHARLAPGTGRVLLRTRTTSPRNSAGRL